MICAFKNKREDRTTKDKGWNLCLESEYVDKILNKYFSSPSRRAWRIGEIIKRYTIMQGHFRIKNVMLGLLKIIKMAKSSSLKGSIPGY